MYLEGLLTVVLGIIIFSTMFACVACILCVDRKALRQWLSSYCGYIMDQEHNQCTQANTNTTSSPTPAQYQCTCSVNMYKQDSKTRQNLYIVYDLENMSSDNNSKTESANDVTSTHCAYRIERETDILEEESACSCDCYRTLTNPSEADIRINSEEEDSTPPKNVTTPQASYVTIPVPPQSCPKTPHPSPPSSENLTPSQSSRSPSSKNPTPPRQSTGITASGVLSHSNLLACSQSSISVSIQDLSEAPVPSQSMPNLNNTSCRCPLRTRGGRPIVTSSVSGDVNVMGSVSVENPSTGFLTSTRVEQSITSI